MKVNACNTIYLGGGGKRIGCHIQDQSGQHGKIRFLNKIQRNEEGLEMLSKR